MSRVRISVVVLAAAALVATGCGATGGGGTRLSLVAYSTPREAYAALIPAFQKTDAGGGVSFSQSYGASGDQSRAVASGLPSDVVALSLAPDMTKLADAGLVARDWAGDTYRGMVTDSVVVLVVRKGNPRNIHTWDDLARPGTEVITPNPFSSGGARWNVMGAYGAQIKDGKSPAQAKAFVDFLRSAEGQRIFAAKGYRPVNRQAPGADGFPQPKGLFTIDDLGGWDQVTRTFFDRRGGVMAGIEREVGVSVGS